MSLVHGLLDGEEREIEGGGVHQAKKLGPASSRGGTSKLGGVPEKLTLVPPALDSGPKWKGGSSGNNGRSSGSANRPRSVGPSRGKSKAMYFSKHRSHRSMEDSSLSLPEEETMTTGPVMFQHNSNDTTILADGGVEATADPGVKMFVFPKNSSSSSSGGGDAATTTTATNNHRPRRSFTATATATATAPSPSLQPVPGSGSDDDLESATTPIQFWSPVPEERSTPPMEAASTIGLPGSSDQAPSGSAADSPSRGGGGSGDSRGPRVNRMMSFFRWRTRSVPIAPNPSGPSAGGGEASGGIDADVPPPVAVADEEGEGGDDEFSRGDEPATPPTPLSMVSSLAPSRPASVVAAAASPYQERQVDGDGGSGYGLPRAPFAGTFDLPTPPSVYGGCTNASEDGDSDHDEASVSTPSAPAAVNRGEPSEGDVEEGGKRAVVVSVAAASNGDARTRSKKSSAVVAAAPAAAETTVAQPLTYSTAEPAVIENGIVMPCAPSDSEKILYHETGRAFLVTTGTLSFVIATVGMWLFTISSPYFYWFGAPTVFLMFYLVFHYFVVAAWGKDFVPDDHEEILRSVAGVGAPPPTIDVYLPVCREDIALLRNTWTFVAALDYPSFEVYVLDDGAKDDVRELAEAFGFHYIRRDNRPEMKKAGNLRYAFARTSGEAMVIFDADFCPRADFLKETTPYLSDPTIGIVQTPQFFRYRDEQTWVEQGAGASQEFFYRMVQMNQDRFGGAVCVGSCGLYRRAAVESFGGVAAISHSEDMYTGYKMTELGYKIKYLPLCLAMGTCPDEPRSFFMQQYRWCMGSASLISEKGFWKADLSALHKVCFFNGLLYYIATAMLLLLAPLPIILLIYVRANQVLWYYSGFALPSILMVTVVMPFWCKQPYGMPVHRVRVIQCYAHLAALTDSLMGTAAAWVPSGGGASRSPSKAYITSVVVMLCWTITTTVLIIGGSLWRMMEYPWYQYVPAIILAFGNFCLNLSSLY